MKKFLTFLLCLGFALSFAACGKENGNGNNSSLSSVSQSSEDSGENGGESDGESGGTETETSVFTVTAAYDYGFHIENQPYMLYNGSGLFFNVPESHGEVVAGDVFSIEHTGEAYVLDIYPSRVSISGEIVSVTAQKAEMVGLVYTVDKNGNVAFRLYDGGAIRGEVKIASYPEYYLTNENGEIGCAKLSELGTYTVLYGTYSPVNGYDETGGYRLSGLYCWNPRGE